MQPQPDMTPTEDPPPDTDFSDEMEPDE
jgi:hypothetical protein